MLRSLSRIFSRITAAMERHAAQHPTHFPAIKTAEGVPDAEANELGSNRTEDGDDSRHEQ